MGMGYDEDLELVLRPRGRPLVVLDGPSLLPGPAVCVVVRGCREISEQSNFQIHLVPYDPIGMVKGYITV